MSPYSDQIRFVAGLVAVATLSCFLWIGWASFTDGYREEGRTEIKTQWDAEKLQDLEALQSVRAKLASAEENHLNKVQELSDGLVEANEAHATSIAVLRAQYAERLRQSERRAELYSHQAKGSPGQQAGLAEHTARLDRSLTEGVLLVEEFIATIGQRDAALIAAGKQIRADRELLEEIPDDHRN